MLSSFKSLMNGGRVPDVANPCEPASLSVHAAAPFVLVAEDILAHMMFLKEAHVQEGTADGSYVFDVEAAGKIVVSISASADSSLPVTVAPLDEGEPAPSRVVCTISCKATELLTMLAGGAASLSPSDLRAMRAFLSSFDFSGYHNFCKSRHLRPWDPGLAGEDGGRGRIGDRVARSLTTLATGASSAAKEAAKEAASAADRAGMAAKEVAAKAVEAASTVEARARRATAGMMQNVTILPAATSSASSNSQSSAEAAGGTADTVDEMSAATSAAGNVAGGADERMRRLRADTEAAARAAKAGMTDAVSWLSRTTAALSAAAVAVGPVGMNEARDTTKGQHLRSETPQPQSPLRPATSSASACGIADELVAAGKPEVNAGGRAEAVVTASANLDANKSAPVIPLDTLEAAAAEGSTWGELEAVLPPRFPEPSPATPPRASESTIEDSHQADGGVMGGV